jgi:hypothetical protein
VEKRKWGEKKEVPKRREKVERKRREKWGEKKKRFTMKEEVFIHSKHVV